MSIDLTTYTETDPNNRFVVTAPKVVVTGLQRDEDAWVIKDYGVDFFGDGITTGRTKLTARDDNAFLPFDSLTNVIDDLSGIGGAGGDYLTQLWANPSPTQTINLRESASGVVSQDPSINLSLNTDYYWKRVVAGTAATLFIYSDALMTTLVDTLSITLGAGVSYRYHSAVNSWNSGNVNAASGEVGDFEFISTFNPSWARNSNQIIGVNQ